MSQTALQYKSAVVKPADSSSWTPSAVNGLLARVRYSTHSTPNPYWDAIVLEAAVTDYVVTNNDALTAAQALRDLSTLSDAPAYSLGLWLMPSLRGTSGHSHRARVAHLLERLTQAQIQAHMNTPLGERCAGRLDEPL